jgi:hypothetical protein
MRGVGHAVLVVALTLLTQLGGLAWLIALGFRYRVLAFLLAYTVLWLVAFAFAPYFGREALPCFGTPLRMQSPAYCLLMRNYVTPELAETARDAADLVELEYPGTVTLALDGSFPFFDGMPLLPHLSHDDGKKLDFAFFYQENGSYLPGKTRSAIGYWAFELADESSCPPVWLTARWNQGWLQSLWPSRSLEPQRTTALAQALLNDPRVAKVFLEPPLAAALKLVSPKLRFQGCRAARHDDHIHVQL